MSRKALPEKFQALRQRSKMQQKLKRRLEELGLERAELEDPLGTIEDLSAMRTLELLADPDLLPSLRINRRPATVIASPL